MKKLLLISVIALVTISTGCEKVESRYCASCVEQKTQYRPVDFCGTSDEVDQYIKTLYQQGRNAGQIWTCSKK